MTKHFCDLCGKEIPGYKKPYHIRASATGYADLVFDVCPDCYESEFPTLIGTWAARNAWVNDIVKLIKNRKGLKE